MWFCLLLCVEIEIKLALVCEFLSNNSLCVGKLYKDKMYYLHSPGHKNVNIVIRKPAFQKFWLIKIQTSLLAAGYTGHLESDI